MRGVHQAGLLTFFTHPYPLPGGDFETGVSVCGMMG
jgi:hypothetical protein